jgi:hypothetical protein
MLQNPTSAPGSPRPDATQFHVQVIQEPDRDVLTVSARKVLRTPDRHLLALLGTHGVLTTGQLVRLTGMPERTVQHRVGVLFRAGLVSRYRPRVAVGSCSYHCWLTAFGATVVGAEPPGSWSEDLAGMRTVAAMSDLCLGIKDHGAAAGLTLKGWRRLPDGLTYRERGTGANRRLSADAELTVGLDGSRDNRALLFARLDRIPVARLAPVLARWADCLTAQPSARATLAALVLTGGPSRRDAVLDVVRRVRDIADHVAAAAVGPRPVALATGAVWRTPVDGDDHRLAEVLASIEAGE